MSHYKAEAAALGMPVGDYLALKLAQAHGLDEPAWLARTQDQPPLVS